VMRARKLRRGRTALTAARPSQLAPDLVDGTAKCVEALRRGPPLRVWCVGVMSCGVSIYENEHDLTYNVT
jgi:hypothetical protein